MLPFFIKDLKDTLKIDVQTTPLKTSFSSPSVIICAESSILNKNYNMYEINTDKENQHYTPDINKLFTSFAQYSDEFDISILIMTGIGSDGVEGAIKLKEKGATIYAQDEESSPVFGMPKAAIESGIVDCIKSFSDIKELIRGF